MYTPAYDQVDLAHVKVGDPIWLRLAGRSTRAGQLAGVIRGICASGRDVLVRLVLPVPYDVSEHVLPGGPPGYVRAEFTPVVGGAVTVTNGGRMSRAGRR